MSSRKFFHTIMGSSAKSYFLDDFPIVEGGAWSLRKLSSTYTGNCIRVRRSFDNAEQVIGFVNDVLDIATMEDFVTDSGAQPTSDGYVTRWYEQSGVFIGGTYPTHCTGSGLSEICGGDLGSNTTSTQPKIVLSGTTYTQNGFPQMRDWNKNYLIGITPPTGAGGGNGWMIPGGYGSGISMTFLSTNFHPTGMGGGSFGGATQGGGQTQASFLWQAGGTIDLGYGAGSWNTICAGTTPVSLDNIHMVSSVWVPAPGTTYFNIDGTQECSLTTQPAFGNGGYRLTFEKSSLQPPAMEFITYNEEKSAADVAAMETAIMTYYEI